jgi:hypothetical protein
MLDAEGCAYAAALEHKDRPNSTAWSRIGRSDIGPNDPAPFALSQPTVAGLYMVGTKTNRRVQHESDVLGKPAGRDRLNMKATPTPHAATFSSRFADYFKPPSSPAEYLARLLKQSSISLTLGVFIGAALTTGVTFGAVTAYLANEKVLRRLVKHAGVLVHHTRDAVLNTREGRALARALLAAPSASSSSNPSNDARGDIAPQITSVGLPAPPDSHFDSGMGLAALRDGEILPPVYPTGGHYLPYQLGPGNT